MSPDEAALIAAICAASDDDLPRLVYADWLDEQGRHIRADFIRSQIELNRLEEWFGHFTTRDERKADGPEFGRRLRFLRKRVNGLLNQHHDEAVGMPDGWAEYFARPDRDLTVNRGCIDGLKVNPAQVRWLPELFSRFPGPPPAVTVCGVEAHLAGFAWVDPGRIDDPTGWEWVTTLVSDGYFWHEYHYRSPITPVVLARLAPLPFPRLGTLNLRHWELTDDHARVLAERFNLPTLRSLDLRDNRLAPAGVRALSEAPWWAGLQELALCCFPPVQELVEVLTAAPIPGLRSLAIGNNHELRGSVGVRLLAGLAAAYPTATISIT